MTHMYDCRRDACVSLEFEMENLPTKKGTTEVAKLATGIAGAIAGIFLPGQAYLVHSPIMQSTSI